MNDTFSMARIKMLTNKMLRENRGKLLLMTGVLLGSVIIMALLCGYSSYLDYIDTDSYNPDREIHNEIAFGVGMLFLFGTIAASMVAGNMSSKPSRLSVLMLPATTFEKFILRLTLFLPVFVILFIASFYLADFLRFLMMKCLLTGQPGHEVELFNLSYLVGNDPDDIKVIYLICCAVIVTWSFFTLGSSLWERNAYLKTLFALGLIYIAYLLIGISVSEWFTYIGPSGGFIISQVKEGEFIIYAFYTLSVTAAIINYTLSFFRFRESEIINRW